LELANGCAKEGYNLLIAADEPAIEQAATSLRSGGVEVADLATTEGVDKLYTLRQGAEGWMRCCLTPDVA
jgi:hypothetical protein